MFAAKPFHFSLSLSPSTSPMTPQQALHVAMEYERMGKRAEAERVYRQVLAVAPNHPDALNLAGLLALKEGRAEEAAQLIGRAVALLPSAAFYQHNLALALGACGQIEESIGAYRRAIELQPDYAMAHDNLGVLLLRCGRFAEALAAHRRAVQLQPSAAQAQQHLGTALALAGESEEAIGCHQRAVQLRPDMPAIYQDYLTQLSYSPQVTLRGLHTAHVEFERRHAAPWRARWQPHANSPAPDRPLRLGFVSAHFADHPVGRFLIRPLEHLDRRQFQVCGYANSAHTDEMTARLRATAATWREVHALNDDELAAQVRADGVDILFDLSGHTAGNRLLMFARKPAPIQITWLDYVGTTGLTAMDYILADPREIPPGAEHGYAEKVLRLPDDYICYDPPTCAPPAAALPALTAKHVTFASFNLLAKTTPEMIARWARILQRVPASRLLMKNVGLDDAETRRRIAARFQDAGIVADRLDLSGWSPPAEVLAAYGRVDIALDTFPYNGGLTTCEAIWMGVPVVTCPGETFASRHGLAHLTAAGLGETIAQDLAHYEDLAVALAADLPRLSKMRQGMREKIVASPLCDGARFARNLEVLLRGVWQDWAAKCAPRSVP
jgi:predicted O-linked N-acetylglucosamine transferase (SPINDLY family)